MKRTVMLFFSLLGLLASREAQAFYNPSTGRWLSRDPIGENGGQNLYPLLSNHPISRSDFLGLYMVDAGPGWTIANMLSQQVCGCRKVLKDSSDWAKKMQQEYKKCEQAGPTGKAVKACVDESLAAQGISVFTAGSTDKEGNIKVETQSGICGSFLEEATKIHETVHAADISALEQQYGAQADVWKLTGSFLVYTEVRAYSAEIPYYDSMIRLLNKLPCCGAMK